MPAWKARHHGAAERSMPTARGPAQRLLDRSPPGTSGMFSSEPPPDNAAGGASPTDGTPTVSDAGRGFDGAHHACGSAPRRCSGSGLGPRPAAPTCSCIAPPQAARAAASQVAGRDNNCAAVSASPADLSGRARAALRIMFAPNGGRLELAGRAAAAIRSRSRSPAASGAHRVVTASAVAAPGSHVVFERKSGFVYLWIGATASAWCASIDRNEHVGAATTRRWCGGVEATARHRDRP